MGFADGPDACPTMMPFTAVILAGGKSSRMGRDKAFLPFQGSLLIERALKIVRDAGADEVLISGRPEQDFSAYNCRVLLDRKPDCGPLAGIERALSAARHPLVLVLAVDLPHMAADFLVWLLARGHDESRGAVPVLLDHPEPLAALYPKRAHDVVRRMLVIQNLSARDFAETCIRQALVCPVPVPPRYPKCFVNWNSPHDLRDQGRHGR